MGQRTVREASQQDVPDSQDTVQHGDDKIKATLDMQSAIASSLYALKDVPGNGKGLVATRKILKGTRILCEEAIITLASPYGFYKDSIIRQVDALSEYQRAAFESMPNLHPYNTRAERYLGIFQTVALPAQLVGDKAGIFLEACRINHACDNNAQKSWNGDIKRHTVHALRDIESGEEITITYLSPLKTRKVRQERLQNTFGFTCSCRLCSLPAEQSQESDRRLQEIARLDNVIDGLAMGGISRSPLQALRFGDQQAQLYREQGREDVGYANTFINACQLAIENGDLARGRVFAQMAASIWKTSLGDDSVETIKYEALAQNPSTYRPPSPFLVMRSIWKTNVDDVPRGLEANDFEDWLWKREQATTREQPGKLANRARFPGFADLPSHALVDVDYNKRNDVGSDGPQRHWCFLGEILDSATIHHLEMKLRDVDGRQVPLHFYTKGLGTEITSSQFRNGYTVAILDARRRVFTYGNPGIRHEETRKLKIFPLSLKKLLLLNDQIQQFSTKLDGTRTCHGCGLQSTSLQRCGKCSVYAYCNKACQMIGWKEKGHKTDCKLLRDSDLRGLLATKWDESTGDLHFPLEASH